MLKEPATIVKSLDKPLTSSISFQISRKVVMALLSQLSHAGLTVTEPNREQLFFGDKSSDLQAQLTIHNQSFYKRLLQGGSIAAGEAYIDHWWESPNVTDVIRVLARNLATLDKIEAKTSWITQLSTKLSHKLRRNNQDNAKQNISAHYDRGNDLYSAFLDRNMLYSAAIYQSELDDLYHAQINKMDRLCQQLALTPDDHLLEIGTGWGGMAIYAAQYYGCKVTTTTISKEQYAWAQQRVDALGLNDQITLLLEDYRDLTGEYDKIVSIEMIEAVGREYLDMYIEKCQSLLKPGGRFAIQAITIADQRYDSYSKNVDFIQKHIFPGGFLPSVTVLLKTMTEKSDFIVRDMFDMGLDYARTLNDWHRNFNQNIELITLRGYDERFVRMWRYYFCYCEGGFLEKTISAIQLVAERPKYH
ncbi:class I SAM-dependent methyltransferase [Photobacterium damselae]|uniref:class I SAM-dependent methyltransferase n=1 Tax=Photobacterium damselae TaxID=38293 RepID=UPI00370C41CF